MQIKPIRNEKDYRAALRAVERLWNARAGTKAHDRLDVLATLVEAYEERHHTIDAPDAIEAIRFRMDQLGLDRKDLEKYVGSRARVSEVRGRKRRLSLEMIRRLNEGLGVPAESLLR